MTLSVHKGPYTFVRNSAANLGGTSYASGEPRIVTAAYSASAGAYDSPATTRPECVIDGVAYFAGITNSANIYRQTTADASPVLVNDSISQIRRMWGMQDGTLLVAQAVTGQPDILWYSTDGGVTLQRAQLDGNDFQCSPGTTSLRHWNLHQAANGTVILTEYADPISAHIYRSTDNGHNWTEVYSAGPRHFHAVCKQEALGRWIAVKGDTGVREWYYSDDDGVTWQSFWSAAMDYQEQPTTLIEYGHPTRLACGSDSGRQFGWVDVSDANKMQTHDAIWSMDRRDLKHFVFDAMRLPSGDWLIAAHDTDTSFDRRPGIYVGSPDMTRWACVHRFSGVERGVNRFAGVFNGQVLCEVRGEDGTTGSTFRFPVPPSPRPVRAVLVEPTVTNVYTAAQAKPTATTGWTDTGGNATISLTADGIRAVADQGEQIFLHTAFYQDITEGDVLRAQLQIRATPDTGEAQFFWRTNNGVVTASRQDAGLPVDGSWATIDFPTYTVGASDLWVRLLISMSAAAGRTHDIEVRNVIITKNQSLIGSWQAGASTRAEESMAYQVTTGAASWSHSITIWPRAEAWQVTTGQYLLARWAADADNYVLAYLDAADGNKLKLRRTVAGVDQAAAESSAGVWYDRRTPATLTLDVDGDGLTLTGNFGGLTATVEDSAHSALVDAAVTCTHGTAASMPVLPMAVGLAADQASYPRVGPGISMGIRIGL